MVPDGASLRLLKAIDDYNQYLMRYEAAPSTSRYRAGGRVTQGKLEMRRMLRHLFKKVEDEEEVEIEGYGAAPPPPPDQGPDDEEDGTGGAAAEAGPVIVPFI